MIQGAISIPRVEAESTCRTAKDYVFSEVGVYQVHSNSLMPNIQFEESLEQPKSIDKSIFLNDDDTMPTFNANTHTQNFITARFIGRAPLEYYGTGDKTKMGRQFVLVCQGGNPNPEYRCFGTQDAIHGFNRNANDNTKLPGGDD